MNRDSVIVGRSDDRRVFIDNVELTPTRSFKFRNHSPDGFSWGYNGSGPSQFALALLLEATDEKTAVKKYQDFKRDIVSGLSENFTLNASVIYDWMRKNISGENK